MMPRRISRGPTLDGELRRDHRRPRQHRLETGRVAGLEFDEGRQVARLGGQRLLPIGTEILDDRGLEHRLLTRRQFAGDRNRHPPETIELGNQSPDPLGAAQIGLGPEHADQLDQHLIGIEKSAPDRYARTPTRRSPASTPCRARRAARSRATPRPRTAPR